MIAHAPPLFTHCEVIVRPSEEEESILCYHCLERQADSSKNCGIGRGTSFMSVQKSRAAHLLRQVGLRSGATAQGLMSVSAESAKRSFITGRLEQIGACHEKLACVIILSRCCKERPSRVQYNIDVVKRTQNHQVLDAV